MKCNAASFSHPNKTKTLQRYRTPRALFWIFAFISRTTDEVFSDSSGRKIFRFIYRGISEIAYLAVRKAVRANF